MGQNPNAIVSLATSSIMLALFFVLVFLRIPKRQEWRHFQLATWLIAAACLVLSASNAYTYFRIDSERAEGSSLESIIILLVGCYQALLFTITSIALVCPTPRLWLRAMKHLAGITAGSAVSLAAYVMWPEWQLENVAMGGLTYLAYIIYLTTYFHRKFHLSVQRLEDVYDDDMQSRLQWVRTFFYGALGIGVFALLTAIVPSNVVKRAFDISVPIYYIYVTIRLVNYVPTSSFVVKTFTKVPTPVAVSEEREIAPNTPDVSPEVEQAIEAWVAGRRYAVADATVDEIVDELHVSKQAFNAYFKNVLHTQFRSWRRELRIREAMRMMDASPQLSIVDLMAEVGYNDRSNFYKDFQQIAGVALKDYRDRTSA